MSLRPIAAFSFVVATLVAGCGTPVILDESSSSSAIGELRILADDEIVGDLGFGETVGPIAYTDTPKYRALRVQALAGDLLDARIRTTDGEAIAWILASDFRTLAASALEPRRRDATVTHRAASAGTYYVAFRERDQENATFAVSLAARVVETDAGAEGGIDGSADASPTCEDRCTAGASRCAGIDGVQVCLRMDSGCLDWTKAALCPGLGVCEGGLCRCKEGARRCADDARVEECVDGTWTVRETCGTRCTTGRCEGAPTTPVCGNGVIEGNEICDDGNRRDGDGCSANCDSVECTGELTYEDPKTHHCYRRFIKIYDDIVSRQDAAIRCSQWGRGYLVQLETAAEREAIQSTVMPRGYSWIGLRSWSGTRRWDRDDGVADPAALPWLPGFPRGTGTCAEWNASPAGLRNVACNERRDFVCERAPIGVRPTTPR
jgi:cysteine-rich repeat protein